MTWSSVPPRVLDRLGHALGDERDVDRELLRHPDDVQVDMERPPGHAVGLDSVHQHRRGGAAVDRQVDQRVRAGVAPELSNSCASMDTAVGLEAPAEDDGGQPAVTAQVGDLLAGHLATGRRRAWACGSGGHAELGPPEFDWARNPTMSAPWPPRS